jgi:fused signal recognition particle receptor
MRAVEYVILGIVLGVLVIVTAVALVAVPARRRAVTRPAPRAGVDYAPGVGNDAEEPRDTPTRGLSTLELPESTAGAAPPVDVADTLLVPPPEQAAETLAPELEVPAPTAGRLVRLRARLARSQTTLGRGLLALLSRDVLDDDVWEEVEDTLLTADVGVAATQQIVENLRTKVRVLGTRSPAELRRLLREELVAAIGEDVDRSLHTLPHGERPSVVLVVGVNGTGKTTTCGKLARVLIADGRSVVLGAADTFRAAAADQLQTWASRVGAETVRGPEGGDPASVAFDAVKEGIDRRADTVLIDTAGRLHTKQGLMD